MPKPRTSESDAPISTKAAAERLGVSVATIARWVTAGKLVPALRLEGRTGAMWFRSEDIEALCADESEVAS